MNNEIIFLVQDSLDGGYEAKALDFPIFTEADTINNLHKMVKDSVRCHFETDNIHYNIHPKREDWDPFSDYKKDTEFCRFIRI